MGMIGDLFDTDKGAGMQATQAPLLQTSTPEDYKAAQQAALAQQQQFLQAVNAQGGIGKLGDVYNQYQGVANGTGPNPAQAMLNNATGQNVANQSAMMASQRGASANPAMLARMAAQQGAGIQQQAAGQGAAMQAQQQLAAMGQMGGVAGQLAQMQGQGVDMAQRQQQMAQQGVQGQNQLTVESQNNANNVNASIAKGNQAFQSGLVAGGINGLASAGTKMIGLASGGEVGANINGPRSFIAKHLKGTAFKSGGIALPPAQMNIGSQMQSGGKVPGKASVKGNSYSNDTVDARLSPGEVVIPKSIMESKDPAKEAAKFVAAIMAKKGRK